MVVPEVPIDSNLSQTSMQLFQEGVYCGALRARGIMAEEGPDQKTPKRLGRKGPCEMLT